MEKWIETDLEKRLAYIKESAWQHAGEQINIAEMYLRKHPSENDAFDSALASLHEIEAEMGKKLDLNYHGMNLMRRRVQKKALYIRCNVQRI